LAELDRKLAGGTPRDRALPSLGLKYGGATQSAIRQKLKKAQGR